MNTELVRSTTVVGKSMSDAMDHADYAAASNSAVLQLKAGDEMNHKVNIFQVNEQT